MSVILLSFRGNRVLDKVDPSLRSRMTSVLIDCLLSPPCHAEVRSISL